MKNFFALLLSLSFIAVQAQKQAGSVNFQIDNLKIATVEGSFSRVKSMVKINREQPEYSKIKACVDVASIETGINMRDKHLRSEEFFDAEKFPEICFYSNTLERIDETDWWIEGMLVVKGQEFPLKVKASIDKESLRSEFEISRIDIGVGVDYSTFTAGEMVKLKIDLPLSN